MHCRADWLTLEFQEKIAKCKDLIVTISDTLGELGHFQIRTKKIFHKKFNGDNQSFTENSKKKLMQMLWREVSLFCPEK